MKLSPEQKRFMDITKGKKGSFQVATSQYSVMPIEGQWKPFCYMSAVSLRGLVKRGLIKADFFWRGANVEIVEKSN